VGQGDCTLISSNGKNALIDTGTEKSTRLLSNKLKKQGIKNIDVISLSHFHADHTGGIDDIVSLFNISNLIYPEILGDSAIADRVYNAKKECLAEDGNFYTAKPGMTVKLGDFDITVLYYKGFSEENDRSVYLMAKIGEIKFLFTGDGDDDAENGILNCGLNLDCDILKVPHHGSRTSSSDMFLNATTPKYAVISCGKNNSYGHPHNEAIARYASRDIETYRTDKDGDVIFEIDGEKIAVNTSK